MLQTAAINGLAVWFRNIINWFRRLYYHLKGADSVYGKLIPGDDKEFLEFSIDDNGTMRTVKAREVGLGEKINNYVTDKGEVELLWILGAKRAMVKRYQDNTTMLVCDAGSIVCLVLLITSFATIGTMSYKGSPLLTMLMFMGSIVCMIVFSVIRRKYRK